MPDLPLTPRQLQVLGLLCQDHSRKEIAQMLGIKVGTVHTHILNALRRTERHEVAALVISIRFLPSIIYRNDDVS